MKKIIVSIFLLVVLLIAGYFTYGYYQDSNIYRMTLQSELNPVDFRPKQGQMKQVAETYQVEGLGYFTANILQYSDELSAANGVSALKKEHNPGMIVLGTKYVNYYADPASNETYHHHFYQSGKNIIYTDYTGTKDNADAFIVWYYSKYPNQ